ncbi:MFS transporter [Marinomonas agarivorans]|nr:MFS transporter [Marinomonas agarivorans]
MPTMNRIMVFGILIYSIRMLIGATSTLYILSKGLTLTDIGLLKAYQALIILLFDIPLAYIADKYSRKLSLILSTIFASVWLFLMAIGESIELFYIAETCNALSIALFSGAFIAYLIDNSHIDSKNKNQIKKILSKFSKYQHLGMALFSIAGAAFITINSPVVWFISATLTFSLVIFGFLILPKDCKTPPIAEKTKIYDDIKNMLSIMKNNGLIIPTSLGIVSASFFYQLLIQFWQPLSFSNIIEKPQDGFIFGIILFFILMCQSLASYISEKVERIESVIIIGNTLNVISIIVFLYCLNSDALLFPIAIILMFLANKLISISYSSIFHSLVSSEYRTTMDSGISSISRLVLVLFLPAISFSINFFGWFTIIVPILISILLQYFDRNISMKNIIMKGFQ